MPDRVLRTAVSQPPREPARRRSDRSAFAAGIRSSRRDVPSMHARARTPPRTASVAADRRRRARRRRWCARSPRGGPGSAPSTPAAARPIRRRVVSVAPAPLVASRAPPRAHLRRLVGLRVRRDRADARLRLRGRRRRAAGRPSSTASAAAGISSPGIDGGTYGERIAALDPALDPDLVIVEGSINDRRLSGGGIPGCRDRRVGRARAAPTPTRGSSSSAPRRRCCRSNPPRPASTRICAELAAAPRLVVHLADRRGVDHPRQLPRRHRHRPIGRNHPSTEGHAYLADRLGTRARDASPKERMSSPTRRWTKSSSDPDRGRRPGRGW